MSGLYLHKLYGPTSHFLRWTVSAKTGKFRYEIDAKHSLDSGLTDTKENSIYPTGFIADPQYQLSSKLALYLWKWNMWTDSWLPPHYAFIPQNKRIKTTSRLTGMNLS
jgi:hypothetical protein